VLARRFRPQAFAEVIGQQPVAQALQNAIRHGRVAHAAGALLALRSLISLMAQHKQVHERKLRNQAAREASPATESGQEGSETRSPRAAGVESLVSDCAFRILADAALAAKETRS
jgi:hypothetical protein